MCQQQQERMTKELKYTVHDIFRVLLFHHCQRIITPATAHVGAMDVRIHRVPIKRRHCDGSSNARVGDDDRIDWRHSFCQSLICRSSDRRTKIEHRFNNKLLDHNPLLEHPEKTMANAIFNKISKIGLGFAFGAAVVDQVTYDGKQKITNMATTLAAATLYIVFLSKKNCCFFSPFFLLPSTRPVFLHGVVMHHDSLRSSALCCRSVLSSCSARKCKQHGGGSSAMQRPLYPLHVPPPSSPLISASC